MLYSKFDLPKAQHDFGLIIHETVRFLPELPVVEPDTLLKETLLDDLLFDSGSGIYLFSDCDREESLTTDLDDRLWAAAELFITTGKATYEHYFAQHLSDFEYTLFERLGLQQTVM